VAAQMTDMLQNVVLSGTGRAANIGRPTAGKTGTTSSNKDGWFLGFSSGITTGVWMGRDDNRPIPGLAGGRAPSRAFHDFMVRAVANRPVESFNTNVALPDWQVEPDDESWNMAPDQNEPVVDADGNPVEPGAPSTVPGSEPAQPQEPSRDDQLDQEWLDRAINSRRDPPPRREPPPPPRRREEVLPPLPGQRDKPDGN